MTAHFDDATLTKRLAQGTGEILKGVRNVGLLRGRELGDAGDDLAQNWIARVLEQHRPDDGFLSEEAADNPERLGKDRVWIIDPLDGTKEFATGRQDWAVHIALVENGIPTTLQLTSPTWEWCSTRLRFARCAAPTQRRSQSRTTVLLL